MEKIVNFDGKNCKFWCCQVCIICSFLNYLKAFIRDSAPSTQIIILSVEQQQRQFSHNSDRLYDVSAEIQIALMTWCCGDSNDPNDLMTCCQPHRNDESGCLGKFGFVSVAKVGSSILKTPQPKTHPHAHTNFGDLWWPMKFGGLFSALSVPSFGQFECDWGVWGARVWLTGGPITTAHLAT